MGQNYSNGEYKKTYEGDYEKSFDLVDVRNPKRPYQGLEKSATDVVAPDGPRRTRNQRQASLYLPKEEQKAETNIPKVMPRDRPIEANRPIAPPIEFEPKMPLPVKEPAKIEEPKQQAKPIEPKLPTPPPVYKTETKTKPAPKATRPIEQKLPPVYNPLDTLDHPIKLIGIDKYVDVRTDKTVDEEGARDILLNNGYVPKKPNTLFVLAAIALFTMSFNPIMPIVLIITSWFSKNKQYTSFQKNVAENVFKFQMPANDDEIIGYTTQGNIFMVIGAVLTIISIAIYSNG